MQIAGLIGAANQAITSAIRPSGDGKADSVTNNVSFLGAAREVSENLAGRIVVGNGANIKEPGFKKEDFEYDREMPDRIENVYDFIAEIRKILHVRT